MSFDRCRRTSVAFVLPVALAAAGAVTVTGCGGDVHDLSVSSTPLLVVHGHVDTAALMRPHPTAPLLGALVWAAVPAVNPVCLEFSDPRIAGACPDPYGVVNGEIEQAVPVDANGDFDIALDHLPMARVSVGDASTRVAYGSLLAVEDTDGDGQPTIPRPPAVTGRRNNILPAIPLLDTIVAASFSSLHAPQQRVVFREGGFVTDSNFYPDPGCPVPPAGFSVLSVPPYTGAPADAGTCTVASTDTRVEIAPLVAGDGYALLCRPLQQYPFVIEPTADEPPPGSVHPVCLQSPNVFAVVYGGQCTWLRSYALSGCAEDPLCVQPEWTFPASDFSWWPCQ